MNASGAHRPELVAPAGSWEALRAAVANGADAVYFGLSEFSARQRAANFAVEELPGVVAHLHGRNVRGYVTFNTLVFSDELPRTVELLSAIAQSSADAVIVQDLGLVRLIRRLAPGLPIHASTQMTLTEPRAMEIAQRLGVRRVVLPRELTIPELRDVAARTDVELEVFVHGALCISFSGQCLSSEALGGRSANRGQCAQACRLPYRLVVDGRLHDAGQRAYPLSPHDLAAYDRIGDLVGIGPSTMLRAALSLSKGGIHSFKIEGRLKSAEYVAITTQVYRAALDATMAKRPFSLTPEQEAGLALSFSRGFSHGFLDGVNHQRLVDGRSPKSRGLRIGTVVGKTRRGVVVAVGCSGDDKVGAQHAAPLLKAGDGVVFDEGRPEEEEKGGRVFAVQSSPGKDRFVEVVFGRGHGDLNAVPAGCTVWKTDDPALRKRIEQSYARDKVVRPAPLTVRVRAVSGQPLHVTVRDDRDHEVEVASDQPLVRAEKHPLSLDLLREHFSRLGGTPFDLASAEAERLDPVMAPKSVLNDLRRRAVESLVRLREAEARHPVAEANALDAIRREIRPAALPNAPARLYVLVRDLDQLDTALESAPRPDLAYADLEEARAFKEAVKQARDAGVPIGLAAPRIIKPGEDDLLRQIAECRPDAILVRNLTSVSYFHRHAPGVPLVGDQSLNAANEIAAHVLQELGLARITPSCDLNWGQMAAMLGRIAPDLFEVVIHQHVPMFHMQHCVFAAFLSEGADHRDCGRPCRRRVELRDRVGADHPVMTDAGCRTTVFNAAAQSGIEYAREMRQAGVRHFRVEMLRESAEEMKRLLECCGGVLHGSEEGRAAWRQLQAISRSPVTRGTFK